MRRRVESAGRQPERRNIMENTRTSRKELDAEIYVGNLPYDVTQEEILFLLKEFNPVHAKKVQKDLRCFAFVQMSTKEDASRAVAKLHKMVLRGRNLVLRMFDCDFYGKNSGPAQQQMPALTPIGTGDPHDTDRNVQQIRITNLAHGVSKENVVKYEPSNQETPSSSPGKKKNKIYVDDLRKDVTEDRLIMGPGERGLVPVCQEPQIETRFGGVEVVTSDAIRVGSPCNGTMYKGSHLNQASGTSSPKGSKRADGPPSPSEQVPGHTLTFENSHTGQEQVTSVRNPLLIPMEMSGPFLAEMLKGCFGDLGWLGDLVNTSKELSLLVTRTYPNTDYFWAVPITQEIYVTLSNLCLSLVQAKPGLPCLMKDNMQRVGRCMAPCVLMEEEEGTWSRCWVASVAAELAVVFFLDYGVTNVIPINTLKALDDDQHWGVPPMAQPFLLLEGPDTDGLMGTVLKGRICGICSGQTILLGS
ncbi:tudor domain-containing protein 10 isoform X2 [Dendropsophus ebraccatus]|uniref:tudor domain-containing protein 10 isoform X2 n=1 Tax=Dendropsophus ebraccatus TaxID=150705 RepID=UPI0038310961